MTRDQILKSLEFYLEQITRVGHSEEALVTASREVFDQDNVPNRILEKDEYYAYIDVLERLGPWPQFRTFPAGEKTVRCTIGENGRLIKAEEKMAETAEFRELATGLNEVGPFRFRWVTEN
ncbi:MAG: hypothetical protein AAGH76_00170 [Pseudomonadota bacterium]